MRCIDLLFRNEVVFVVLIIENLCGLFRLDVIFVRNLL